MNRNQTSPALPTRNGVSVDTTLGPSAVTRTPLSIVNLLADEEVLGPPSRPKTPQQVGFRPQQSSDVCFPETTCPDSHGYDPASGEVGLRHGHPSSNPNETSNAVLHPRSSQQATNPVEPSLQTVQQRLEREYIRQYFYNLHCLHPMLDPTSFTASCEQHIWNAKVSPERNKIQRHFLALYNIVVAVGALVSGSALSQNFEQDIELCVKQSRQGQNSKATASSQELSKTYFRRSQALLRNVFEVCSLESAQTLLLMVRTYITVVRDHKLMTMVVAVLSKLSQATRLLHVLRSCCSHCACYRYRKRVPTRFNVRPQGRSTDLVVHLLSRDRHELQCRPSRQSWKATQLPD